MERGCARGREAKSVVQIPHVPARCFQWLRATGSCLICGLGLTEGTSSLPSCMRSDFWLVNTATSCHSAAQNPGVGSPAACWPGSCWPAMHSSTCETPSFPLPGWAIYWHDSPDLHVLSGCRPLTCSLTQFGEHSCCASPCPWLNSHLCSSAPAIPDSWECPSRPLLGCLCPDSVHPLKFNPCACCPKELHLSLSAPQALICPWLGLLVTSSSFCPHRHESLAVTWIVQSGQLFHLYM